jgi:hypothetical protein
MAALVSAESVREFYRELWGSVHQGPDPGFFASDKPLPPFLCRSLAFGTPALPDDCSWIVAMTGSSEGVVERIDAGKGTAGLYWGVAGISPQLHDYASIAGHSVMGFSAERKAVLEKALALIAGLGGSFLDTVCDYTGLVLWLDTPPGGSGAYHIISSSFPGLPHCVVMTDRAAMGVLPDETFRSFSAWALAESLYHESLHQLLSATILQEEIFVDSFRADAAPTVHVAWRNADWSLDRSLHALFVYANISRMRLRLQALDMLDGTERDILARVQPHSIDAAKRLGEGLDRHRNVFTDRGNRLLTEMQEIV